MEDALEGASPRLLVCLRKRHGGRLGRLHIESLSVRPSLHTSRTHRPHEGHKCPRRAAQATQRHTQTKRHTRGAKRHTGRTDPTVASLPASCAGEVMRPWVGVMEDAADVVKDPQVVCGSVVPSS